MVRKYKKIVFPFLILCILLGYTLVRGEDWEVIAVTKKAKYLCSAKDCLHVSDNIVRVWTKTDYVKPPGKGNSAWNVDYSLDYWEIDCLKREKAVLEVVVYNSKGEIKKRYEYYSNPDRSGISPGTIGEALYQSVCSTKKSSY
jgi:hypothetical protein